VKKIIFISLLTFSLFSVVNCSKKIDNTENQQSNQNESVSTKIEKTKKSTSKEKIDYDLSNWNYNMLTGLNFDMAIDTEKYRGKTFKMRGQFFSVVDEESGRRFYSCLKYDETACCQVGIDFVLSGNKKYPDDFPPEKANIEVFGKYVSFEETNGFAYDAIICDEIKILD